MNIENMFDQTGALDALQRDLGVDHNTAAAGAAALMPALMKRFGRAATTQSETSKVDGGEGLAGLIGSLGGGALLADVQNTSPTPVEKGNMLLGELMGSKDNSRAVAQAAAGESGVDPSLLKKMLPVLAMAAAGYLAKQSGSASGGLGGLLGNLLGTPSNADQGTASPTQSPTDLVGQLMGAAGKFLNR